MYVFRRYNDDFEGHTSESVEDMVIAHGHRRLNSKGELELIDPQAHAHQPQVSKICHYEYVGPMPEEGEDE